MRRVSAVLLSLVFTSALALAQSGHWEGEASIENHAIRMNIDLAQDAQGAWIGTVAFPDLKTSAMKLSKITVTGTSIKFDSPGVRGFDAIFGGGKSMVGSAMFGRYRHIFRLERVSDAKLEPAKSPGGLSKAFQGDWQGAVKYGKTFGEMTPPEGNTPEGTTFGVLVRFSAGPDGLARGELARADEQAWFPLDAVVQDGDRVRFEVFSAAAVYEGTLQGDRIVGEWRQLGAEGALPLILERAANR